MASLANLKNWHKVPELRRRVIFTMALLAVYRLGAFITTPGVDRNAMRQFVASQSGNLLGLFNLFTGGALQNLSIFALGIMPYISASIILQLMGMVYQPIAELKKEGEAGRRKIDQYTRYGTVALSAFQAFGISKFIEGLSSGQSGMGIVNDPGIMFQLMTVITLTTGTAFLMWLGEQIPERGSGSGIPLTLVAGLLSALSLEQQRVLVVTTGMDAPTALSVRNLATTQTLLAGQLSALDVLKCEALILTKEAVSAVEGRLS